MRITDLFRVGAISMGIVAISACSTTGVQEDEGAMTSGTTSTASYSAETYSVETDSSLYAGQENPDAELLAKKVFYFDFDQSNVSMADYDAIAAHARYVATNSDIKVRISGHADERGTREYNIALGERRANAVADIFAVHGIEKDRLDIISYGEEAPVALGHGEEALRLNRRVELSY